MNGGGESSSPVRFVERNGERYRVLLHDEFALWLISFDSPAQPFCVVSSEMSEFQRVETPEDFECGDRMTSMAQQTRLQLIQPLLDAGPIGITERQQRGQIARQIATEQHTSERRILRLYYKYLATGRLTAPKKRELVNNEIYDWAIKTFYFSAKRLSLRGTYEMMLLRKFTNVPADGSAAAPPTWLSFRSYFYSREYHKDPRKVIAREGLTHYQRNSRAAFGSAASWREHPGSFQMDATQADIYLVSRHDRSRVIGRPYIYLAVDTATQLITGFYVGLECDESAVMLCLASAAQNKVSLCKQYGIEIAPEQWPSCGLPNEIVTDKGREFFGPRMGEVCKRYGLDVQSLPPFRPDQKGLVEKCLDLIQERFKPLLRGKGVIEADAQERWSVDYRDQSVLNLDEFTKIVIYCILYLNSGRPLVDGRTPAQHWLESEPHLLEAAYQEVLLLALPRTSAKLTRTGLRVNKLTYVPTGSGLRIGERYTVAYDRSCLSHIYIVTPTAAPMLCSLSADSAEYAGLSQPEAELQRAEKKSQRQMAERKQLQASVETIQGIETIIKAAEAEADAAGVSNTKNRYSGRSEQEKGGV